MVNGDSPERERKAGCVFWSSVGVDTNEVRRKGNYFCCLGMCSHEGDQSRTVPRKGACMCMRRSGVFSERGEVVKRSINEGIEKVRGKAPL